METKIIETSTVFGPRVKSGTLYRLSSKVIKIGLVDQMYIRNILISGTHGVVESRFSVQFSLCSNKSCFRFNDKRP